MAECSFCGTELPKGQGTLYAKNDGKILYFCKKKCEKNMLGLKRKAKDTKWTNLFNTLKKASKK
jgi:large subunit ribosomal protein L24e